MNKLRKAWSFVKSNKVAVIVVLVAGVIVGPVVLWAVNKAKAKIPGAKNLPDVKPLDPPAGA